MNNQLISKILVGGGKPRQCNIELLRIIAMVLIVMQHSLHSNSSAIFAQYWSSYFNIGVNVFVLITGFFGANLSKRSLLNIAYICFFYAIVNFICSIILGNIQWSALMFFSKSNWFIPTYVCLLLLTPFLNTINLIDRKRAIILVIFLCFAFLWFCYFPRQAEFGLNNGYSLCHFIQIYLIGRILGLNKEHICNFLESKKISGTLLCLSVFILLGLILVAATYFMNSKGIESKYVSYLYRYNNPIVILESILFFLIFTTISIKNTIWIQLISRSTLAVLLLHGGVALYPLFLNNFKYIYENFNGFWLVSFWCISIISIFFVATILDCIRFKTYGVVSSYFQRKN